MKAAAGRTESHRERVRSELSKAGISTYSLLRPTCRYVHRLIHEDEHIGGAIVGRYEAGTAMLVATDKRVIFLDHKPLVTSSDEITYSVVAGVKHFESGPFAGVTLHTRVQDYQLRYVNKVAAHIFVQFIEGRTLETRPPGPERLSDDLQFSLAMALTPSAKAFLVAHEAGVFSTVDRTGNVSGTAVYYLVNDKDHLFILTKSETAKARNTLAHPQAALTIFEEDPPRTLELRGSTVHITDPKLKDKIFNLMVRPRRYTSGKRLPPVTQLNEGSYVIIRFIPTTAVYHPYQSEKEHL